MLAASGWAKQKIHPHFPPGMVWRVPLGVPGADQMRGCR